MNRKALRLDIGGGTIARDKERYTTVDVCGEPDVKADMWELPYQDNTIEEIWSSHSLEHIPMAKVIPTLKEWNRVLKVGGRLILSVPNFDYVARYWLTGADRVWAEYLIFGMQRDEGDFHRCAFSPSLLKGDLEGTGFEVKRVLFEWSYNQETLKAVAVKRAPLPSAPPVETTTPIEIEL